MTYKFNYGMGDSTRDTMASVTKTLIQQLQDLESEVQTSLAEWEDNAKDAYGVAKKEWDAAALRMPTSLNTAERTLSNISDGYLHVEHSGANRWGGYGVK